jgi:dGTP triphosphohydrolase
MDNISKLGVERQLLLHPKIMRMEQISLAIDHSHKKDRKENRYSHSIEVANGSELMNAFISEKLGFKTDYRNVSRIIGLLHDIGHTAFSHLGEITLNKFISKKSKNKLFFDGNANNYIVIEKNNLLNIKGLPKLDKEYILASLAKHPENLYFSQNHIKEKIKKAVKSDKKYLEKYGISTSKLEKTIQCQIMDIADENCYIISDIIDSQNILSKAELIFAFREELNPEVAEELISALNTSDEKFVSILQDYYFSFTSNFTIEDGLVIPEDKDIEEIRKGLFSVNRKYVLNSIKTKKIKEKNRKLLLEVFDFYYNSSYDKYPSKYYREEAKKASSKIEKLSILRDMLGNLTDRGIKKLHKEIK